MPAASVQWTSTDIPFPHRAHVCGTQQACGHLPTGSASGCEATQWTRDKREARDASGGGACTRPRPTPNTGPAHRTPDRCARVHAARTQRRANHVHGHVPGQQPGACLPAAAGLITRATAGLSAAASGVVVTGDAAGGLAMVATGVAPHPLTQGTDATAP